MVCNKLQEGHQKEWSEDSISTKIKLIAERKPYAESASAFKNDVVGKYEDTSIDRMWRWEFGIVEVLPSAILSKVRKARTARRKVLNHYMTNQRLLKSLEDADSVVRDMKTQKLDSVIGKIGKDEEKVLKFDREAEKQRLAQLATRKKDQELEAKRKEKELKKEEAEKKRLEKEKEKQEAVEARDAEKRKKTEVKERQEQEKKQKEQQKKQLLNRQKACLMSFFANPAPKESKDTAEQSQAADTVDKDANKGDSTDNEFNPSHFRSLIDSQAPSQQSRPLFSSLSKSAVRSRKRRTRKIPVSVYVTVIPESNGFDEQPFAEQQIIHIPNKYRFLSFHEDYRPPYHGTWSKQSKVITGRTPLNKDTTNLDYDYDSEGEWEEGDDEIGEDVDDDAKNQEEEEEEEVAAKVYDYDDGFCVADDQYLDIDEDVDEETKALYKKKLQRGDEAAITANRICIIGPVMGGKPPSDNSVPELMEGFDKDEATELLAAHTSKQLCQDLLWLDAFAPDKIDELDPAAETEKPPSTASSSKQEHTVEEMKALALFAHHCTLNSKDKLIEELRNANPDAFVSRAAATRKLDSIAEKKKHPSGTGVYWEVNKQVLEELQLSDILVRNLLCCSS
jgi:chromatin assembly factor 1 subunit A